MLRYHKAQMEKMNWLHYSPIILLTFVLWYGPRTEAEIEKRGRDSNGELKVRTDGINQVRGTGVHSSRFGHCQPPPSLSVALCLSLSTDEIADDLYQTSAEGAADCCFVPVRAEWSLREGGFAYQSKPLFHHRQLKAYWITGSPNPGPSGGCHGDSGVRQRRSWSKQEVTQSPCRDHPVDRSILFGIDCALWKRRLVAARLAAVVTEPNSPNSPASKQPLNSYSVISRLPRWYVSSPATALPFFPPQPRM